MASVNPLVAIVGETASGKTTLAIELARKFNGEIICADSRTIYRGMDIGTAKPTKAERAAVPHHLLDIRNPDEKYSALQFKNAAQKLIDDISSRGKLAILVGGSGLYVDSVLYDYQFAAGAERDKDNPRHAAKPAPEQKKLRSNTVVIGVQRDGDDLEQRVRNRIGQMLEDGLLEETKSLVAMYGRQNEALRGSGYYFWDDYLNGRLDKAEASEKFVRNHMLLARKQRTWFKRNKSIHWLTDPSKAVDITTTYMSNLSI